MRSKVAILLFVAALMFTGACTRVSPGYVGIQVNAAGTDRGVSSYPIVTGRVWYNPINTSVLEYPTFVQNVALTKDINEGHAVNEEITFTNKDQMQIAADISFAYHLDSAKVPQFYVKFRSDDLEKFTHGYMRSVIRDRFNDVAGRYAIEQIMGDNGPFLKEVKDAVQSSVADIGVVLESQFGFIGAPRPPQNVIASINAKVQAVQTAQQKENELRQTEAEAKKTIAQAEGAAKAAIAEAQGRAQSVLIEAESNAKANRLLNESLTSNLIDLKRIEKWNGSLPQVNGVNSNPFVTVK